MECDLGFCVFGVLHFDGMFGILHFDGMPCFVLTFGMVDFCRFGPTNRHDPCWGVWHFAFSMGCLAFYILMVCHVLF
jgi:hypothetical protein